jgi:septal ring factor EnvC (AmiA/AmiB activator)
MRFLPTGIVLLAVSTTIPAISQSTSKSNLVGPGTAAADSAPASQPAATSPASAGAAAAPPAAPSTPPVSAAALRADMERQDKVIKNQIDTQQNLRKKNKDLMKEAQKLDEKNKKLEAKNKKLEAKNRQFNAEKKNVDAQNADLARKHDAIKAAEKPIQTPTN